MLTCGIDIGLTSIEIVLHDGSAIVGSSATLSGAFPAEQARKAFDALLEHRNLERSSVARTAATGFGRNYFEHANRVISEITCHAVGVLAEFPHARTVIEIGGQDSKMMKLDDDGKVRDFVMNDRCAAGTGRFIETVARTLNIPVEETGVMGLKADTACEISSMCAVFAESEIVGLLHQGRSPESVLRGVFNSVARRMLGMAGRIGMREEIVFTGGVARNRGVLRALQEITGHEIRVPSEPQFTGALGAAILALREPAGKDRITSSPLHEVA